MPRLKRRLKNRHEYTVKTHGGVMTHGHDYWNQFVDDAHRHEAWRALRAEIMPAFIMENPGQRPDAWWRFDMPAGTRRECTGGVHPHDDPTNYLPRVLSHGKPRLLRSCDMSATYETQTDYLRRHSMLSAAELKELSRKEATS